MDKMDVRFARTIANFKMLKKGDAVLVALSGGPDSVALLHLLIDNKDKYGIKLAAAHLDHAIRRESSKDRDFCRKLCQELGVKFYSKRANIPALANKRKQTVEEAARQERYAYFESLATRYGFDKIATGHTADDSVESVIFNLTRGSGLNGLQGILPVRGNINRPLIEIHKSEILRWLKSRKIGYRIDRTNQSLEYSRNRIRRKIIPELERLNNGAAANISRFSKIVSEEIELIDRLTVSAYEKKLAKAGKSKIVLDLAGSKDYDKKLWKKLLLIGYRRLSGQNYAPSFETISAAADVVDGRTGGKAYLGDGIWVEKSKRHISISRYTRGDSSGNSRGNEAARFRVIFENRNSSEERARFAEDETGSRAFRPEVDKSDDSSLLAKRR